jgi:hypothetical protein
MPNQIQMRRRRGAAAFERRDKLDAYEEAKEELQRHDRNQYLGTAACDQYLTP